MTRLVGIDHVQLGMPAGGEDAAREFYGELLGLREVPKPPQLADRGGVWFAGDGVALHLGVGVDVRPSVKAHTAFVVSSLAAFRERLVDAGLTPAEDDSSLPVRRCYVVDPFGNLLEFVDAGDAGFTERSVTDGS